MIITKSFCVILLLKVLMTISGTQSYQLIYAVNAGGDAHLDVNGIQYAKDDNNIGQKGVWSRIAYNVAKEDVKLYRSNHYYDKPFHFEIPVLGDGKYWLILKFVEMYSYRLMNVTLNNHLILRNFNSVLKAGKHTAYDEFIYFNICNNQLIYQNESSDINDRKMNLKFIPFGQNYAFVSAIVLLKGNIAEISKLAQSNYTINEDFMKQDRQFECNLHPTSTESVEPLEKTLIGAVESLTGSVQSLEKTLTGAIQSLEKTISASVEKLINVYTSQQQHHEEKISNIIEL
jgi:hypothetical protein